MTTVLLLSAQIAVADKEEESHYKGEEKNALEIHDVFSFKDLNDSNDLKVFKVLNAPIALEALSDYLLKRRRRRTARR